MYAAEFAEYFAELQTLHSSSLTATFTYDGNG
jgi:hypothetical protein